MQDKHRAPPVMLETAMDAEADPKGLQQQLQMVLSGTDDAPIAVMGELGRGAFGVVYKGTPLSQSAATLLLLSGWDCTCLSFKYLIRIKLEFNIGASGVVYKGTPLS
jgi:hypothetical protein